MKWFIIGLIEHSVVEEGSSSVMTSMPASMGPVDSNILIFLKVERKKNIVTIKGSIHSF